MGGVGIGGPSLEEGEERPAKQDRGRVGGGARTYKSEGCHFAICWRRGHGGEEGMTLQNESGGWLF